MKNPKRSGPNEHPGHEKLPECIKQAVTEKEYSWMSDAQRNRLQDEFCMPEPEGD